ncbi:MAG: hypothetical protein Q9166_005588 [cf. Caloplaca sp. 2 TL-2023]
MALLDYTPSSSTVSQSFSYLPAEVATIIRHSTLSLPTITSVSAFVMTSLTSVQASATPTPPGNGSRPGANGGECQLLGEASIFIQGALGGLALLSLVYKRWRERPQRPLKIWFFDVSKQTTIGIPILIILLRLLTYAFSLTPLGNPPESIQSGHYGHPAKASWWLKQSFIYFIGLLGMKACVFVIFQLCPWLIRVGDWALKWTEGNETVQVFFVMFFFPVVMNALQYYIIDGFIKNQKPAEQEADYDNDRGDDDRRTQRPRAQAEEERPGDGEDGLGFSGQAATASDVEDKPLLAGGVVKLKINPKRLDEYDPSTDGETSPAPSEIRRRNSPAGDQITNELENTARCSS